MRQAELTTFFALARPTMPHPTTWSRVLGQALDPRDLEAALRAFFHAHAPCATPSAPAVQLTLDGKTIRGTIPAGATQGVHLLAVYLPGLGLALTQVAVDSKANELTVAPPFSPTCR